MPSPDEDRAAELLERLLTDAEFRAAFRRSPADACEAFDLPELAEEFSAGKGKVLHTLEIRESRSSLAGALMAASSEGSGAVEHLRKLHEGGGMSGSAHRVVHHALTSPKLQAVDPSQHGSAPVVHADAVSASVSPGVTALLDNPRVTLSPEAHTMLAGGHADPRLVSMLDKLAKEHSLGIGSVTLAHGAGGDSLDITSVDGSRVSDSNIGARDLANELSSLDPSIRPVQIVTPWPIDGPGFSTGAAGDDRIHLIFDTPGSSPPAQQAAVVEQTAGTAPASGAEASASTTSSPEPSTPATPPSPSTPSTPSGSGGSTPDPTTPAPTSTPPPTPSTPPATPSTPPPTPSTPPPTPSTPPPSGSGGSTPEPTTPAPSTPPPAPSTPPPAPSTPPPAAPTTPAPSGSGGSTPDPTTPPPSPSTPPASGTGGSTPDPSTPPAAPSTPAPSQTTPPLAPSTPTPAPAPSTPPPAPSTPAPSTPPPVVSTPPPVASTPPPVPSHQSVVLESVPAAGAVHHATIGVPAVVEHSVNAGAGGAGFDPSILGLPDPSNGYPGDNAPKDEIAAWMARQAHLAGLPAELPIMAALTESSLHNDNYGDRDSLGYFQMRTSIWNEGEYKGFSDHPELQLKWFINEALTVRKERIAEGDATYGQDRSKWGDWVADVEQPAAEYRGRYQTHLDEADGLLQQASASGGMQPAPGSASAAIDPTQFAAGGMPAAGGSPVGNAALAVAEKYLGTPYQWGGDTPQTGFDCSGLMEWSYNQIGIHLPRVAADQFNVGVPVTKAELKPGDLVFFQDSTGYIHHVGMYIGDDKFIEAPHTGADVRISSLDDPYYAQQFAGGRDMSGLAHGAIPEPSTPSATGAPAPPATPAPAAPGDPAPSGTPAGDQSTGQTGVFGIPDPSQGGSKPPGSTVQVLPAVPDPNAPPSDG